MTLRATLELLLHARLVEAEDGCLVWTGPKRKDGYGLMFDRRRHRLVGVHQLAWELAHRRRLPAGKLVRQRCGRRDCARLEHLYLSSKRVLARTVLPTVAGNLAKTRCPRGHRLAGKNVYRWRGERHCRTCHRERERRRYHAQKARAA
jgi:hypothetical protein